MYAGLDPFAIEAMSKTSLTVLVVFAATGLVIAWLNHRLRRAEDAQRTTAATAIARAEQLDAILNTTVDGIIVIDAMGAIEAFNRGAQELFGYREDEVLGRNVSLLMPAPDHEQREDGQAREHQQRRLPIGAARPHRSADRDAVDAWQRDVEHDQLEFERPSQLEPRETLVAFDDFEPGLGQVATHQFARP